MVSEALGLKIEAVHKYVVLILVLVEDGLGAVKMWRLTNKQERS